MYLLEIIFVVALLIIFPVLEAHACKIIIRDQNLSESELVNRTELILIAKVKKFAPVSESSFQHLLPKNKFNYEMEVVSILKGNSKIKKLSLREFDGPDVDSKDYSVGNDCQKHGGFKPGEMYLIFVESLHRKGIAHLRGDDDPWLLKVKKLIKNDIQSF